MASVCPTVTVATLAEYNAQMERLETFVERIHIDFMDGVLAPTKSPAIEQAWWPIGIVADFHVMYQKPLEYLETIISLNPSLVIIHAEADGTAEFLKEMAGLGIKRGLALLQDSQPDQFAPLIREVDHVLIFSGDLGHYGGTADLSLLQKIAAVKAINHDVEIGWDGGINAENVQQLIEGGVDALNVGGFISRAPDPEAAYEALVAAATQSVS